MKIIEGFDDYKLLQMSNGEKKELWGKYILKRPDPQIIWNGEIDDKVDALYKRSDSGGGSWDILNKSLPDRWIVNYNDMKLNIKLMGFKHTGIFPEQSINWDYVRSVIKNSNRQVKVLNLFAYTGAMSVACLLEGAEVVHVDSSRGMVEWAKENVLSSNADINKIRFIVDDVIKFVKREINRGNKYDIIIMDPPSFGRGSKKEVWSIEDDLFNLVNLCSEILSDDPLLFLINSYSTNTNTTILENILKIVVNSKYKGVVSSDEIGIKLENSDLILPCGIYGRWEKE